MSVIGTQLPGPINSGLTRWRMAGLKNRLAIAIRSLKDRSVTIVSLTQVGVGVMCGCCLAC